MIFWLRKSKQPRGRNIFPAFFRKDGTIEPVIEGLEANGWCIYPKASAGRLQWHATNGTIEKKNIKTWQNSHLWWVNHLVTNQSLSIARLWFIHKGNLQHLSPETPPYFARSANRTASACQGTYICGHSLGKSEGDKYSKTLRWSKMAILSHPSLQVETLVGVKRTGTLKSSIYCAYGIIRHSNLLHILFIYGKNLAATLSNFSFGSPQASICKYMQVGPGFPSSWIFKISSMYL